MNSSERMGRIRQKNTSAEVALRRALHRRGLRYRLHVLVISKPRRIADVAFVNLRIAIFVDGCFWHGCPIHATWPKTNSEFWERKILANKKRDRDTDDRLQADGWEVVRVWAHESADLAADRIRSIVDRRRRVFH